MKYLYVFIMTTIILSGCSSGPVSNIPAGTPVDESSVSQTIDRILEKAGEDQRARVEKVSGRLPHCGEPKMERSKNSKISVHIILSPMPKNLIWFLKRSQEILKSWAAISIRSAWIYRCPCILMWVPYTP